MNTNLSIYSIRKSFFSYFIIQKHTSKHSKSNYFEYLNGESLFYHRASLNMVVNFMRSNRKVQVIGPMHLPALRIKCRFNDFRRISNYSNEKTWFRNCGSWNYIRMTFCVCVLCFVASATLPLQIDYYFSLLWFIIYFFSIFLLEKVALYYAMGSNDGRLYWISCATHSVLCVLYASCSDIVSSETWITSSFDLSFVQISLGQWNFMAVRRTYNGFKLWIIPNVLSRRQKKEISHWEWK